MVGAAAHADKRSMEHRLPPLRNGSSNGRQTSQSGRLIGGRDMWPPLLVRVGPRKHQRNKHAAL